MSTVVYYPRIKSLNFYDDFGIATGGMRGGIAKEKFHRMVRDGKCPRISLRKRVRVALGRGGSR